MTGNTGPLTDAELDEVLYRDIMAAIDLSPGSSAHKNAMRETLRRFRDGEHLNFEKVWAPGRIKVESGRRIVQGNGAPWEAWATVMDCEHPVRFGAHGASRAEAEQKAVAALMNDQAAAKAGYAEFRSRTV